MTQLEMYISQIDIISKKEAGHWQVLRSRQWTWMNMVCYGMLRLNWMGIGKAMLTGD